MSPAADGLTRRAVLGGAAAAATLATGAGRVAAAGANDAGHTSAYLAAAATGEALAVTAVTTILIKSKDPKVDELRTVLRAANRAHLEHVGLLTKLGGTLRTRRFWLPDTALKKPFAALEKAEELLVDLHLLGIQGFAGRRDATTARQLTELMGVDAQLRSLARGAQDKPPSDVAFERFDRRAVAGVLKAVRKELGVGLGTRGDEPGSFAAFRDQPPPLTLVDVASDDAR